VRIREGNRSYGSLNELILDAEQDRADPEKDGSEAMKGHLKSPSFGLLSRETVIRSHLPL
jgi:hypothetical protein